MKINLAAINVKSQGYTTPIYKEDMHPYILFYRGYSEAYVCTVAEDIRGAYPLSTIKSLPHRNKTMPDFAAVKGLVEQHFDSYRCSGASLVQALCI